MDIETVSKILIVWLIIAGVGTAYLVYWFFIKVVGDKEKEDRVYNWFIEKEE